ncbi:MAG: helix-turn-helix domain-containing protein [Lachnospiraceae bacterium]|nr:helix-turn-helix domain-containing protein [Lachnospiraceae bacterium]
MHPHQFKPDKSVAGGFFIDVSTVRLCVRKHLEGGTAPALYDRQRKGRAAEISPEAVACIINIACQRPADLEYSQELWTLARLHKHIQYRQGADQDRHRISACRGNQLQQKEP